MDCLLPGSYEEDRMIDTITGEQKTREKKKTTEGNEEDNIKE